MGSLAHLVEASEGSLSNQFKIINKNLESSLSELVTQTKNAQNESYTNAVQNVILSVNNSQKLMLEMLEKAADTMVEKVSGEMSAAMVGELTKALTTANKSITDEISGNKKAMSENNEQSQQQLIALGLQIDGLPEPEKVDLSALNKDIKAVGRAVESIPKAKFPDLSSQFKKIVQEMADLRERLDTREIVFDIERRDDLLVKRVTGRVIK